MIEFRTLSEQIDLSSESIQLQLFHLSVVPDSLFDKYYSYAFRLVSQSLLAMPLLKQHVPKGVSPQRDVCEPAGGHHSSRNGSNWSLIFLFLQLFGPEISDHDIFKSSNHQIVCFRNTYVCALEFLWLQKLFFVERFSDFTSTFC